MTRNYPLLCLIGLLLFCSPACKKEKPGDSETDPTTLTLELSSAEVFPFELFYLTSSVPLSQDQPSASFNGVVVPMVKADSFTYALALPEMVALQGELSVSVGSGIQKFAMVLKALPANLTLDRVIDDHELAMNTLGVNLKPYIDSIQARTGFVPDPAVKAAQMLLEDSMDYYRVELNKLDFETKKAVAAFFYANLVDLQAMNDEISQLVIGYSGDFSFKKANCSNEPTPIAKIDCYFNNGRTLVAILKSSLIKNSMKAAVLGGMTGVLAALVSKNQQIAWAAAEKMTFTALAVFVARDVLVYYDLLTNTVLLKTFIAVNEEFSERKAELVFHEGKSTGMHYRVVRRNVNSADKKHNIPSVTNFINEFMSFIQAWTSYMPDWVNTTPAYAPQLNIKERPEKLSYLSIVDISNPKVQFASISGLPHQPDITFTSTQAGTHAFTFRIKYKDELFETISDPISSRLEPFNPCANTTLSASLSKTAAVLTASATGGTAPYTYTFRKGSALLQGITNGQFIMSQEGKYDVIVVDANGCRDTSERLCVQEAIINSLECYIPSGKRACFRINYTAPNGLKPGFEQTPWAFFWYTSTTDPYLDPETNMFVENVCDSNGASMQTYHPYVVNVESGDNFNKTLKVWFYKNTVDPAGNTPTAYTYKIRFMMPCSGDWECDEIPGLWFSQEYTLDWP